MVEAPGERGTRPRAPPPEQGRVLGLPELAEGIRGCGPVAYGLKPGLGPGIGPGLALVASGGISTRVEHRGYIRPMLG